MSKNLDYNKQVILESVRISNLSSVRDIEGQLEKITAILNKQPNTDRKTEIKAAVDSAQEMITALKDYILGTAKEDDPEASETETDPSPEQQNIVEDNGMSHWYLLLIKRTPMLFSNLVKKILILDKYSKKSHKVSIRMFNITKENDYQKIKRSSRKSRKPFFVFFWFL